jgi:hypothetical protein
MNRSGVIYPEVKITERLKESGKNKYNVLTLETTLRKECEGRWYLWEFFGSWDLPVSDIEQKIQAIEKFHREVYFVIICGEISKTALNAKRELFFKEDKDQITEVDRIKKIILGK